MANEDKNPEPNMTRIQAYADVSLIQRVHEWRAANPEFDGQLKKIPSMSRALTILIEAGLRATEADKRKEANREA